MSDQIGVQIDHQFDSDFADALARQESYNKHLYRPNTYLHKWWARRCGSTFRLILKHLVENPADQAYYTPGGLEGKIILDPMIGGGTTPHEAIRLGANVIGVDIDPIPLLQARATLSKLSLSRLEDAFGQFSAHLRDKLLPYFPATSCPFCSTSVQQRYVLYGQRRSCECQEALFVDSLVLRNNNDGTVVHVMPDTHDVYLDDELVAKSIDQERPPIRERKERACYRCGRKYLEDLSKPFYRRYAPIAVSGKCPEHNLFFRSPSLKELEALRMADFRRASLGFESEAFAILPGPKSRSLIDRNVHTYLDLFSSRQLIFLRESLDYLEALEPLIRLNLGLLISTSLEFNSMLSGYKGAMRYRPGTIRHAFARHAYAFPYTALENNPVYEARASGTLQNLFVSRLVRGRKWAQNPVERKLLGDRVKKVVITGEVDEGEERRHFRDLQAGSRRFLLKQGSSVSLDLPDHCVDYIVTDPPYFDSVQYSDLAAFFRVWLKQILPDAANWEYALVDSAVDPHANGDGQYTSVLSGIFKECHRVLKKDGRLIFTFHHWNPKAWASLTVALRRAGFVLVNRYVVHAENRSSVHILNQKALLHDVILVLAPAESATERSWALLPTVDRSDSRQFCHQCGTIVGWVLDHAPAQEVEIEKLWQALLG